MGWHSILEKATGHKYIDGARPLERGMSAKHTPWNKEMTKSHKKPTIQREEQRHKLLLLFPLEDDWLMRGWEIPWMTKVGDKISTLMPIGGESCNLDGDQTEGGVFHYLDTQPFREGMSRNGWEDEVGQINGLNHSSFIPYWPHPNNFPHGRFELPGMRATTPSTQPLAKKLTQETHQPPPPFRENQLWKPTPLAHAFPLTKDQALPLWMSLNLSIIFPKHLNCSNHARPNRSSKGLPRNKLLNPL